MKLVGLTIVAPARPSRRATQAPAEPPARSRVAPRAGARGGATQAPAKPPPRISVPPRAARGRAAPGGLTALGTCRWRGEVVGMAPTVPPRARAYIGARP